MINGDVHLIMMMKGKDMKIIILNILLKIWNTPHLIIHGSRDYRIPITECISAFTTLQIRGIPSRFLHFPDENHWVLKPSNSIKWYEEILGWLDKYLDNE